MLLPLRSPSGPRAPGPKPRSRLGAAVAALVLCVGVSAPARADLAAVASDLQGLRLELAALQRVQGNDPNQLARFEVRLGQLEEELRQLTGRVESLEFEQRALGQRIDDLVADLDQRLAALEQQGERSESAEPSSDAAGDDTQARPATAPAAPRPGEEEEDEDASAPSPGEGVLGMIPENSLRGLPRPDAEAAVPPRRTRLPPEEQYDAAMDQLRAGEYSGAERGLELFLEVNPEHPLAANAAYWLAESHYVRRDYAAAAAAFARNYRSYGKDAAKAVDNLLKLGMSLESLGENDNACLAFQELTQEFPDAPTHVKQAVARERAKAECA